MRGGGILVLDAGTSTLDFSLFAVGSDNELVRMVDGRLDQLYASARFRAEDAAGRIVTDIDCADESPPGTASPSSSSLTGSSSVQAPCPCLPLATTWSTAVRGSRVPPGSTRPRSNTCGRSLGWRQHGSVCASW